MSTDIIRDLNKFALAHLAAIILWGAGLLGGALAYAYITLMEYSQSAIAADARSKSTSDLLSDTTDKFDRNYALLQEIRLSQAQDLGVIRTDVEVIKFRLDYLIEKLSTVSEEQ